MRFAKWKSPDANGYIVLSFRTPQHSEKGKTVRAEFISFVAKDCVWGEWVQAVWQPRGIGEFGRGEDETLLNHPDSAEGGYMNTHLPDLVNIYTESEKLYSV